MASLVDHAICELDLLGESDEEFKDMIMAVINAFDTYGHSGGSASVAIPMINDLLQFKNLTALTDDPNEWIKHGSSMWQNSRNFEAFSDDGGKTYYLLSEIAQTPYYESEHVEDEETKPNFYEDLTQIAGTGGGAGNAHLVTTSGHVTTGGNEGTKDSGSVSAGIVYDPPILEVQPTEIPLTVEQAHEKAREPKQED